jgi:hypothetical protein
VLDPLHDDPRRHLVQGAAEDEAAFGEDHAEVLERPPRDPAPRRRGQLRKGLSKVGGREPPAPGQDRVGEISEAPADPGRDGDRERGDERRDEPQP